MAKEEIFLDVTTKGTAKRTQKEMKGVNAQIDGVIKSAKAMTAAYLAFRAINVGDELSRQALQAQRADKALAAYTGSVQEATKATRLMQESLGGTVSEFEATQLATKLIALNLADTAEAAANVAEKVAKLGSVFGKDATQAIEEFTLLLANNSILRLDTFGISAVTVKERMKELQAATKGLSRDQAFQTATMEQLNQKAKIIWFTGLSGSGKSTLASQLEKELFQKGFLTQILDGDNIRAGINNNLTFTKEDRIENIRRVSEVSKLLINCGVICINSFTIRL